MILILHRRSQKGVKIIDYDHIEINVDEVENSAIFYNFILGFDKVFVFNHWAVLQSEMSILPESDIIEKTTGNISFIVNSDYQMDDILKRLSATGQNVIFNFVNENHKNTNISFFDPSGNLISISTQKFL